MALSAIILCYAAVIGACVGSFLNVLVARLPEGKSVIWPRSSCPRCGSPIRWYDNLPLLSYALLAGRCRACRGSISCRYPLVEALTAAIWVALTLRLGVSRPLMLWLPLASILIAITFLDLDHWWIPDLLVLPACVAAIAFNWHEGWQWLLVSLAPASSVWGIAVAFKVLMGREGMGLGDVKLLALMGLALGAWGAMVALMLAAMQGALAAGLMHLGWLPQPRRETQPDGWTPPPRAIPFGPFLVLGTLEVILLALDHPSGLLSAFR